MSSLPAAPRVSILIPNYNNGRSSSKDGQRDFIAELLQSLATTLAEETTPFEILAFDDGSTDESIDTLRDWAANRTWPDGRPFLTLTEAPHCGILSITANKLSRAAKGDILARLDGDVVCLTHNWVTKICGVFDRGPSDLGVIGPKQLLPNGMIYAYGDWILHPKGYHHIGTGLPRDSVKRPMEVDHVMGCFYCCRREVYEDVGGYDENYLRGQTIDFGMQARLLGWRTWAIPHVEFLHLHALREARETTADTDAGIDRSRIYFQEKWGFDRITPDLDVVRKKYINTPLLWNARWFGISETEALGNEPAPANVDETDWGQYASNETFRKTADWRLKFVASTLQKIGPRRNVVELMCESGLLGNLIGMLGVPYMGFDPRVYWTNLATQMTGGLKYSGPSPEFHHQADGHHTTLEDGWADVVLISNALEGHPNPVAIIEEAKRLLAPNGLLLVTSTCREQHIEDSTEIGHRYTPLELLAQLQNIGGLEHQMDPVHAAGQEEIAFILKRVDDPSIEAALHLMNHAAPNVITNPPSKTARTA